MAKTYEWEYISGIITGYTKTDTTYSTSIVKGDATYGVPCQQFIRDGYIGAPYMSLPGGSTFTIDITAYLTATYINDAGSTVSTALTNTATKTVTTDGISTYYFNDLFNTSTIASSFGNGYFTAISKLAYTISLARAGYSTYSFTLNYITSNTSLTTAKSFNILHDITANSTEKAKYKITIPNAAAGVTLYSRNLNNTASTVSLNTIKMIPSFITNHTFYTLNSDGSTYTSVNRNSGTTFGSTSSSSNVPVSLNRYWTIPTDIKAQIESDMTLYAYNAASLTTTTADTFAMAYQISGEKNGNTVYTDTGKTTTTKLIPKLSSTYTTKNKQSGTSTTVTDTTSAYLYTPISSPTYKKNVMYTVLVEEDEFSNMVHGGPTPSMVMTYLTGSSFSPVFGSFVLYKRDSSSSNNTLTNSTASTTCSALSAVTTFIANKYESICNYGAIYKTIFYMGPTSGNVENINAEITFSSELIPDSTDIRFNSSFLQSGNTKYIEISNSSTEHVYAYCVGIKKQGIYGLHRKASYMDLSRRAACVMSKTLQQSLSGTIGVSGLNTFATKIAEMFEYTGTTSPYSSGSLYRNVGLTNSVTYGPDKTYFATNVGRLRLVAPYEPTGRTSASATGYTKSETLLKAIISGYCENYTASKIPNPGPNGHDEYRSIPIKDLMLISNGDFGPTVNLYADASTTNSITLHYYIEENNTLLGGINTAATIYYSTNSDMSNATGLSVTLDVDDTDIDNAYGTKTITGLQAATTYYANMVATDDSTSKRPTTSSTVSMTTASVVAPTVTLTITDNNNATYTWNYAVTAGTYAIEGLEIYNGSSYVFSGAFDVQAGSTGSTASTVTASYGATINLTATTYATNTYTKTASKTLYTGTTPTVFVSSSVSNITATGATTVYGVTAAGSTSVTARGIQVSTSSTFASGVKTFGTGTGTISSTSVSMTGLAASTTYYYRSYATNSIGTKYSSTYSFTTSAPTAPTFDFYLSAGDSQKFATVNISPIYITAGTYNITQYGYTWWDETGQTWNKATISTGLNTASVSDTSDHQQATEMLDGEGGEVDVKIWARTSDGNVYESDSKLHIFCCFVAGTQVMLDLSGTTKNIEDVQSGDTVVSYNAETDDYYIAEVLSLITRPNVTTFAKVTLENGNSVTMNAYHPILTTDGWHSLTNHNNYPTLQEGDVVVSKDGNSAIVSIERWTEVPTTMYNLDVHDIGENPDEDTNDNFIANGMVVHNGC